ncbi:hypothetical protein [Rhodoflexus caldus]|uniref:hypothetical protein n=1 Tax=Rhodoflexus caldus TaxID=2891236 RepID=UPI002029DAEF|nr:hypothetical protein [Rhodoflexus caldus]
MASNKKTNVLELVEDSEVVITGSVKVNFQFVKNDIPKERFLQEIKGILLEAIESYYFPNGYMWPDLSTFKARRRRTLPIYVKRKKNKM